jgi:hypothetical protein
MNGNSLKLAWQIAEEEKHCANALFLFAMAFIIACIVGISLKRNHRP